MNKTPFDDLSARINEALRNSPAQDIEKNLRALVASWFDRMDVVMREDFEVQRKLLEQAQAKLDGARQIAQNTPIEVAAAQQSEQQQRARFQSSLATVVEVAVAESILTQAQGDDAIARLNVWRAIADLAVARGNVAPFLKMLGK